MALKYLNDITDNDLAEIKKLAGLFFTPREIAIMLELDDDAFVTECDIRGSKVYNSFHGGRLNRVITLREKIIKLAESGSSPAQTQLIEILKESQVKMMDK